MLGLDPSISEIKLLVLRFPGLRFAAPGNDAGIPAKKKGRRPEGAGLEV